MLDYKVVPQQYHSLRQYFLNNLKLAGTNLEVGSEATYCLLSFRRRFSRATFGYQRCYGDQVASQV